MKAKKIIKHLKGDIKSFKKEAKEDVKLIKELKHKKHEKHESKKHEKKEHKKKHAKHKVKKQKAENKIAKVMEEFGKGELHSGSKHGPVVTNPKQALAIGYNTSKKAKKKKK